jgi:Putative beta-barrel porin 2
MILVQKYSKARLCFTIVSATIGFAAAWAAVAPAWADDEEQRAAAAQSQTQTSGPGFVREIGDSRYTWKPYVESEGGIDTNPDNSFGEDGSGFVKLEAGMKATLERAKEYYALTLKGRFLDYSQLEFEDERHRTDFKAALDTKFTMSDTDTISAGSYFLRDLISPARADIFHSYLEYAHRTEDYRIKLTGKNHTEHNFDNDVQGDDEFDDFVVSRAKAFDYARSDAQVSVLTFTRNMLQPYLIYDFGHIDFYNQVEGASIDRDATEHFGIAGVRLQLNKEFRVDVGYRLNYRNFDDRVVTSDNNGYIDVNVYWKPLENLTVTGVIERYYDESTSSFGVIDDVKTYGVTVDWTIVPRWRLTGTTYFDDENALGDTIHYHKLTSTLALTHDVNDHLEVFVSGLTKWVDETVSDDNYERFKIGTGARWKF